MFQLLIFLALAVFVAVLMRKKRHRPNRKFTPKPVSKSFSRNPNNKGKLKTSATIYQLKQPKEVERPPIVGGCWVIDGDTIHIGSNKIRLQGINAPESRARKSASDISLGSYCIYRLDFFSGQLIALFCGVLRI